MTQVWMIFSWSCRNVLAVVLAERDTTDIWRVTHLEGRRGTVVDWPNDSAYFSTDIGSRKVELWGVETSHGYA
jgi:hypothetical protein